MLILWVSLATLWTAAGDIAIGQALAFAASYVFSMLLLSPDLDLAKSSASGRWGVLRWVWLPYAWIFRHRQRSHHVVWGPLSRILYVGMIGITGVLAYILITGGAGPTWQVPLRMAVPILAGLYLPNLEHIGADRIASLLRKRRSRRL